ncbi:MAG: hypothetical protein EXS05_00655 [Planctomycetaceae bacterium]|nr:hypothetical protein [Planctomycetaceae bacterium]
MNFVGKILVVLILIMSVVFMAFAGAVYTAEMNWMKEANTQKKNVQELQAKLTDKEAEFGNAKRQYDANVAALNDNAGAIDALRKTAEQERDRLKKEAADLQVARKTAGEQALISGEDAESRKVEADNQREINYALAAQREAEFAVRITLEDTIRNLQIEIDSDKVKNKDLLGRLAVLQQALEAAGLSSDVTELAAKSSPPPKVDGIIENVLNAKRQGGTELVEVSLGSDDGLKKGHEMTVYSSGLNGGNQRARYLARIRIVDTTPDKSVGQVIESTRNGVIKKGDNVSTRL